MRALISGGITGAILVLIVGGPLETWRFWALMLLIFVNRFEAAVNWKD